MITDEQIERLLDVAEESDDGLQAGICRTALGQRGDASADEVEECRAVCEALLAAARIIATLILFVVLAACTVQEPLNNELPAPFDATEALELVVIEWSERVPGAEGLTVDEAPDVRWFAGPCLVYPGDDACVRGAYVWALSDAPEIHLATTRPLHKTSLAHEILHWVYDETTGEPDEGHDSKVWGSRHLPEIAAALAAAGL